ncbi:hypothetical protein [Algoriphagus sp.]|uniref:hypothetical protein n=1 Tax=Algoriphagus sp. TaxID=1872435 RepID=UPI003F716DC9
MDIFSEEARLRAGMVSFYSFSCVSLLVFENNQPISYSLPHLEQRLAPSPKGEGWDEVEQPTFITHPGLNPETRFILNPKVK